MDKGIEALKKMGLYEPEEKAATQPETWQVSEELCPICHNSLEQKTALKQMEYDDEPHEYITGERCKTCQWEDVNY
jgi:predicted RecB family nuclease